ncbi:MAG: hypothetical protein IPF60_10950 [Betaproteobacteria bacterium]|nr:hypothetical protein [Betaproteobacteria bacterium]MBL0290901.1 hypothetical protein [Betaproteobacteria bacterium]
MLFAAGVVGSRAARLASAHGPSFSPVDFSIRARRLREPGALAGGHITSETSRPIAGGQNDAGSRRSLSPWDLLAIDQATDDPTTTPGFQPTHLNRTALICQ